MPTDKITLQGKGYTSKLIYIFKKEFSENKVYGEGFKKCETWALRLRWTRPSKF